MWKNIFKTEKRIDENYLLNKFNEIRAIRKVVESADGIPTYTQDLYSEINFIVNKMLDDNKINQKFSKEHVFDFVKSKYRNYYNAYKTNAVNDDRRNKIDFTL